MIDKSVDNRYAFEAPLLNELNIRISNAYRNNELTMKKLYSPLYRIKFKDLLKEFLTT
jgi:hypothetical protein